VVAEGEGGVTLHRREYVTILLYAALGALIAIALNYVMVNLIQGERLRGVGLSFDLWWELVANFRCGDIFQGAAFCLPAIFWWALSGAVIGAVRGFIQIWLKRPNN